jgi:hypothetical protein
MEEEINFTRISFTVSAYKFGVHPHTAKTICYLSILICAT